MATVQTPDNVVPLRQRPKYPLDAQDIDYSYMKVAKHVMGRIEAGEFTGRLPSREALAGEYGVCVQTVTRAINILAERGVVFVLRTKGTYLT